MTSAKIPRLISSRSCVQMEMKDQVVVITGASRGLGAATAKAFGRVGAKIVINYLKSEEKANAIVEEIGVEQAVAVQADVRNQEEVSAMFLQAKEYIGKPVST